MTMQKARAGSVYRRCAKCGRTLAARGTRPPRRCPKCGASTSTVGNVTWSFRLDVARSGEKRKVRSGHGYATADDADVALLQIRNSITDHTYVEKVADTFAEYLTAWLKDIRHEVSAGTWASYEQHVRSYITPRLGHLKVQDVTRKAIRQMLDDLRANGAVRGRKRDDGTKDYSLSPKTCHNIFLTVHVSLGAAVKDRLLARNPADKAHKRGKDDLDPDTVTKKESWWKESTIEEFLEHVADDDYYAMWHVFLWTGARRGEVAAMRWKDLDLDAETWTIARQWRKGQDGRPEVATLKAAKHGKPAGQRRTVVLMADTVEALRRHRVEQAKFKLLHGGEYQDHDLVFCMPDGSPLHPDGISQRWDRHVRESRSCAACGQTYPPTGHVCRGCGSDLRAADAVDGPPKIRLHDARHSHLTWCAPRMGLLETSRRAGHSDIQTTVNNYGHTDIESQRAALRRAAQ